tara:strand:- start:1018 stop:1365 length:348 start_codon:yes stop_codon:yes gene_type:complete
MILSYHWSAPAGSRLTTANTTTAVTRSDGYPSVSIHTPQPVCDARECWYYPREGSPAEPELLLKLRIVRSMMFHVPVLPLGLHELLFTLDRAEVSGLLGELAVAPTASPLLRVGG